MNSYTNHYKIKVSIIGSNGIPAKYGGWETLVENIVSKLSSKFEVTVFCSSKIYKKKIAKYKNSYLNYISLKPNGFQSIIYDAISLYKSNKFADFTIILGVSGAIFIPFLKRSKNKLIINPDGLEWKRTKWNFLIQKFLKFSENIAIKFSDIIVSDNIEIKKYLLKEYSVNSKYIPYGFNHTQKVKISKDDIKKYEFLEKKYACKVCRIEPENNISMILEVFSQLDHTLVIIGNWMNSEYSFKLKNKYYSYKNIYLLDPIFEQHQLDLIRSNCHIYIHGHSAGGTNPSLVEAMGLGLPVIAFKSKFNISTTKSSCLFFQDKLELKKILVSLNEIELKNISKKLYLLAKNNYNWDQIADSYIDLIDDYFIK